jgi:multidrug resistance efflux pump
MYAAWLVQDLRLKRQETLFDLDMAKERDALKSAANQRTTELAKKSLVSTARLENAQAEAAIARDQVETLKARLSRIDLMLRSIADKGVPREDGDTSYWEKSVDALRVRLFDNQNKTVSMRAQMTKAESQAKEERKRISLNFIEEHRAPVSGLINAVFTTEGKRVTAGAPMLEILDCAHPIAIVAIPDNRFGEFRISQKATVKPIDSDESFAGSIQHISSGPLIGRDTTIAVQQAVTIDGNKAIVGLEVKGGLDATGKFCNSARRAIVTIHTRSFFDRIAEFVHAAFKSKGKDSAIEMVATSGQNILNSRPAGVQSQ